MTKNLLASIFILCLIQSSVLNGQNNFVPNTGLEFISLKGHELLIKSQHREIVLDFFNDSSKEKMQLSNQILEEAKTIGPISRRIIKRSSNLGKIATLNKTELSFCLCILQNGKVVLNKVIEAKGIYDKEHIYKVQELMFEYLFASDFNATKLECGKFDFKFHGAMYQPKGY